LKRFRRLGAIFPAIWGKNLPSPSFDHSIKSKGQAAFHRTREGHIQFVLKSFSSHYYSLSKELMFSDPLYRNAVETAISDREEREKKGITIHNTHETIVLLTIKYFEEFPHLQKAIDMAVLQCPSQSFYTPL
jgi:hypothetical protein